MARFKHGQILTYKKAEETLPDILRLVKENINWLKNDKYIDNGINKYQKIIDQYQYFVDNVLEVKTISIDKVEEKIGSTGKPYNVYTLAVRYTPKEGKDRCLFIYNLYDFKNFNQLVPDKFNIKPEFLYTYLDKALNDYFKLATLSLEELTKLRATFEEIQHIIDDIPSFNEQTKLLEYNENSPQSAAYFDGANKTETYILNDPNIQYFIITSISSALASNFEKEKLSGKFGDETHASLHPGPGLGNSDLILTYDNVPFEIEVKDIYTTNAVSGLKDAIKRAHKKPYMVAYFYRLNELTVYKLDHSTGKSERLAGLKLVDNILRNSLYDPETLPDTYIKLYDEIDTLIAELSTNKKLVDDANAATDEFILLDIEDTANK